MRIGGGNMATVQLQVERTRGGLGLWRRWVAANTVGLAAGWAVFALVADGLGGPEGTRRSDNAHLLGLLVAGSLVGLLQGAVLRRQASHSARAAMASGLGLAVGFMAGYALGGPPVDFLLGFTMLGIAGGIAQWRRRRRRRCRGDARRRRRGPGPRQRAGRLRRGPGPARGGRRRLGRGDHRHRARPAAAPARVPALAHPTAATTAPGQPCKERPRGAGGGPPEVLAPAHDNRGWGPPTPSTPTSRSSDMRRRLLAWL